MFQDREFRKLFQNAPIGLAICDMKGKLLLVNQAFADILGRTVDETLRLQYWHITPKQYEKQEKEQLKKLKKGGKYGPYEKHYIHKNKSLVPVRLNGCKVTIDDKQFIWSAVERLEMPIHSATLFKEAPVGLALCQMKNGKLVAANQAFADIIGRSIDETLKLGYWQITPRKFEEEEKKQLESLRKTGKYGPYSKKYIHKDGHLVNVVLMGKALRINDQDFIWSVCQEGEDAGGTISLEEAGPIKRLLDPMILTGIPRPIRIFTGKRDFVELPPLTPKRGERRAGTKTSDRATSKAGRDRAAKNGRTRR